MDKTRPVCKKCHEELKGARYWIKELKEWWCMKCYMEDWFTLFED